MKTGTRIFSALAIAALVLALVYAPQQQPLAAQTTAPTAPKTEPTPSAISEHRSDSGTAAGPVLVFLANSPYALVNGERQALDVPAREVDGTLYAPLKFVVGVYGGTAAWDAASQTATVVCRGKTLSYTAGKAEMLIDGKKAQTTAPARIESGRMLIPANSFVLAVGAKFQEYGAREEALMAIGGDTAAFASEAAMREKFTALPVVGTEEHFVQLMSEANVRGGMGWTMRGDVVIMEESMAEFDGAVNQSASMAAGVAEAPMAAAAAPAAPSATPAPSEARRETEIAMKAADAAGEYSETNIQVAGVDEADVIKTDGAYIYYAKNNVVWIVKATPANEMKLVSTITFQPQAGRFDGFQANEMFVDGEELVVVGRAVRTFLVDGVQNYQTMTRAVVYDITDRANPKKTREVESEGEYLSSRKIGKTVYLITNSWVYNLGNGIYPQPMYRDTAVGSAYKTIGYEKIYYFPSFSTSNYLFITGFETNKPAQAAKVETYLGSGQSVYMSTESLYVASTEYAQPAAAELDRSTPYYWYGPDTAVYRFALDNGGVFFENKQSVPGTILNQFSMDEYDGHFRIATTRYGEDGNQKNGLYILNSKLEQTGKIDDIAPGERIYSTRFMGKRAYMVTFKNVDPLFVIDLADPKAPKILGALKIPGYSNYLHPYDENHLIGIGKDTVETKDVALYRGMKLSLFDVTDVANPKEMFVEIIGDRGTESPVLYDHKALLFDQSRNLLAFPVSVAELAPTQKDDPWQYGTFSFQGAYVYNLDLHNGFKLKGTITHMDEQDRLKAGMYSWDYQKAIERILYIGDNLYTASPERIQSTSMADMKAVGSVTLK